MKKLLITATAFAACLSLCAAVWPQNEPVEETPALPTPPAIDATQPEFPEIPGIEEIIKPEEEKVDVAEPEQAEEIALAPESIPTQVPPSSEVQAPTERNATPLQEPETAPASPDSIPDNMVYVPGFGWIESQGPNHVEYAENMYENGNKIGRMS